MTHIVTQLNVVQPIIAFRLDFVQFTMQYKFRLRLFLMNVITNLLLYNDSGCFTIEDKW